MYSPTNIEFWVRANWVGAPHAPLFGIYFFTIDTKGNPTAGVANIYEHVKVLRELGYDAKILHVQNRKKVQVVFLLSQIIMILSMLTR